MDISKTEIPEFTKLIDLAAERLGGKALACSDDFFAEMGNLLKQGRGVFIADKYTDQGKWMDGWESRRKRGPGHDWCIIKLGASGYIRGLDVDTNFFLGNHPPYASVEACYMPKDIGHAVWTELLRKSPLGAGKQNFFEIDNEQIWTHVRLNIFPDGGVARLKVYGEVFKDWNQVKPEEVVDLAAAVNGGKAVLCNDMFFSHMDNLIMPGRGVNMGDGWETKRNRTPNNRDWVIVKLAHQGTIRQVLVDTCHFKGNYPDSCRVEGLNLDNGIPFDLSAADLASPELDWVEILPNVKLRADAEHLFDKEIQHHGPFTHVRLSIFPDGGVSRLRLFGNRYSVIGIR
jgi:allantoicase